MSTLEVSILIAASVALFGANLAATIRVVRRLGRYSMAYLGFIWLVPVIGAVFVLAKTRRARPASLLPISASTIDNPSILQVDPWPGVGEMSGSHPPFRR